jgi:hypothetical protein
MHRRAVGLVAAILLAAMLAPAPALAQRSDTRGGEADVGVQRLPADFKYPDISVRQARRELRRAGIAAAAIQQAPAAVGDTKSWFALDEFAGFYLKEYTLRGIGDNIEVWVASEPDDGVSAGTDFPAGDCRNGPRTEITDAQVNSLIHEFDGNIYPLESDAFSVPPSRDGSGSLAGLVGLPDDYWSGDGDNVVTLVDNVRDGNFYDTNNANGFSYIAGFYSSGVDDFVDRLVMSIDAFDWLHRTGANPPHEPTTDLCTSAPARPYLYEGVFAHEYQHLLLNYVDTGETIWMNEGLSDWAQTLTGYVDPSVPITDLGSDSHIQCFLGWLGVQTEFNPIPRDGGPENSLNLWGDQNDFEWEILCDYGAAYSMMELLADRFGADFMTALHNDPLHGFESVQALMDDAGSSMSVSELIDTWAATAALDGVLDDGAKLKGGRRSDFRVSTLDATINWDTAQTYSTPGAPPNGSDYVRLRNAHRYLKAKQIHRIRFDGVEQLPTLPIEWVVETDPPGHAGDPALFAGTGDNLDRAIVQEVDVPAGTPELTFDTNWSLETGFDYGYVQVSTDGGATYTSILCDGMVEGEAPFGPAFNGESGGFVSSFCDLSAYAGQTVVVSFRLVTDGSVFEDGFWVDDVALDGLVLSDGSTLDGWSSLTEFRPIDVESYTVRLIAYSPSSHARTKGGHGRVARIWTLHLNDSFDGYLSGWRLRKAIGWKARVVSAIVTYHDGTESVQQYAPYTLRVNGVVQPGG